MNIKNYILSATLVIAGATAIAQPCNQSITATYNNPVCMGTDLQLTATFIPGATYEWEGPTGLFSFVRNTTVSNTTILDAGDYIATATIGSCIYKDTVSVVIEPKPTPPTLAFTKPPCEGDSLLLTAFTNGGGVTISIYDPMGNSFVPQANITWAVNGQYTAVAENTIGCVSDTAKLGVSVLPNPLIPVMALVKPACTGDTISLSASAPGGISEFLFFDPQGNPTSSRIGGINFSNSGFYKCVAISTVGCPSDTAQLNVLVLPTIIPGVAIYGSGEAGPFGKVSFTSLISKAQTPTFTWMRNGTPIPGANTNIYSAIVGQTIMPGDIVTLQVTSNVSPCPGTGQSNAIQIATSLSVNDMDKMGGYAVFPNPSNGIIHIKTNITETYKVDILNAVGSVAYQTNGTGNINIDVTGKLPAGNYIIRISDSKHSISNKLSITQ